MFTTLDYYSIVFYIRIKEGKGSVKMEKMELKKGWIMQLNPDTCRNRMLAGCFMTVTEPKNFGAMGYVTALGENGEPGGQAYYRANYDEMELCGYAEWAVV